MFRLMDTQNEGASVPESKLSRIKTQVVASASVSLGFFTIGLVRAWTSPGIPSMQGIGVEKGSQGDHSLSYAPVSPEVISWMSSLTPLGALLASLMTSYPMEHFGRKPTLILSAVSFTSGFLIMATSSIHEYMPAILVSRAAVGMGIGFALPPSQIYIAESMEKRVRGRLGAVPALAMSLGALVVYIVGVFLPWHHLSYLCASFPALMIFSVLAIPESPVWLLSKNKEEQARKSLKWLRNGWDIEEEFAKMKEKVAAAQAKALEDSKETMPLTSYLTRPVLMPLFISMMLMLFQQWSGINAIIYFTETIFVAVESNLGKNLSTVLVGVVQFFATLVSTFLVDMAGRRVLLIVSGLIMAVSLSSVGVFFYLKQIGQQEGWDWLPLLGLMLFMTGYSAGFAAVPYILMGELFPSKFRNILGSISSGFNVFNLFLVIKLFTSLKTWVGFYGLFWIYAAASLASCLFVLVFLPETKGETLEETEKFFARKQMFSNPTGLAKLATNIDVIEMRAKEEPTRDLY